MRDPVIDSARAKARIGELEEEVAALRPRDSFWYNHESPEWMKARIRELEQEVAALRRLLKP